MVFILTATPLLQPLVSLEDNLGDMARSAMICALCVGYARVDEFLYKHTTFIEDCNQNVCDSFQLSANEDRPVSETDIIKQMRKLRLHVNFANAVIAASEGRSKAANKTTIRVGSVEIRERDIGWRLCTLLREQFLENTLKTALLKPSEVDTHMAQVQARILLGDLCTIDSGSRSLGYSHRTTFVEDFVEMLCESHEGSVGWKLVGLALCYRIEY
jgi:hypothetical protein